MWWKTEIESISRKLLRGKHRIMNIADCEANLELIDWKNLAQILFIIFSYLLIKRNFIIWSKAALSFLSLGFVGGFWLLLFIIAVLLVRINVPLLTFFFVIKYDTNTRQTMYCSASSLLYIKEAVHVETVFWRLLRNMVILLKTDQWHFRHTHWFRSFDIKPKLYILCAIDSLYRSET